MAERSRPGREPRTRSNLDGARSDLGRAFRSRWGGVTASNHHGALSQNTKSHCTLFTTTLIHGCWTPPHLQANVSPHGDAYWPEKQLDHSRPKHISTTHGRRYWSHRTRDRYPRSKLSSKLHACKHQQDLATLIRYGGAKQ